MSDPISFSTAMGAADPARIDINRPEDVDYWTARFAVDEAQLRKAVADVGVTSEAVATHLGASRAS